MYMLKAQKPRFERKLAETSHEASCVSDAGEGEITGPTELIPR